MTARQVAAALAGVGILVVLLFLLLFLGLLIPLIIFLGLALFILVILAAVAFLLLSIVLVPYYYVTKRPEVEPGRYELEDIEE